MPTFQFLKEQEGVYEQGLESVIIKIEASDHPGQTPRCNNGSTSQAYGCLHLFFTLGWCVLGTLMLVNLPFDTVVNLLCFLPNTPSLDDCCMEQ